jgi:hypothetical protein
MNLSNFAAARALPGPVAVPRDGADQLIMPSNPADGDLPTDRFFPAIFALLLPAVISAIPQLVQAFREQPDVQTTTTEGDPPGARFLPELFSVLGPVLAAVIPVLIQKIHTSSRDLPVASGDSDPDQRFEALLPELLGGIVPPLVASLGRSLTDSAALTEGDRSLQDGGVARLVRSRSSGNLLATLLQAIVPAITTLLPELFALIEGDDNGEAGESRGEQSISWDDLRLGRRLSDNDHVRAKLTPLDDPSAIEINIQLGGLVTWWKGAQLRDASGGAMKESSPGDVIRLDADEADDFFTIGGSLVLGKAKFLGVHTWMYRLTSDQLQQAQGNRVTLRWITD